MKQTLSVHGKQYGSGTQIYKAFYLALSLFLTIFISGVFVHVSSAQSNVARTMASIADGDEWHYFKGEQSPPSGWKRNGFDVSNWQKGPSGLGYGIGSNRTYLADMMGNYSSVYARHEFTVDNPQSVTGMNLSIVCDGPFIAYLNGLEMIRTNTIQVSDPNSTASDPMADIFYMDGFIHELAPGQNVLSVQCDNDNISSEDFSLIPVFEVIGNGEVQ